MKTLQRGSSNIQKQIEVLLLHQKGEADAGCLKSPGWPTSACKLRVAFWKCLWLCLIPTQEQDSISLHLLPQVHLQSISKQCGFC